MHLPTRLTVSVQGVKKAPRCQGALAEGTEVWKNEAASLGQPTRQETSTLHKPFTYGWKDKAPKYAQWFINP